MVKFLDPRPFSVMNIVAIRNFNINILFDVILKNSNNLYRVDKRFDYRQQNSHREFKIS